MTIIRKAMQRIEAVTCIRFRKINPEPGKKWVLIMREFSASTCWISYIKQNLKDKEVGNLGKVSYIDKPVLNFTGVNQELKEDPELDME